jgi:hypothetical protein
MPIVGRLDQYASILAYEFDETTANGPSITGLGTYYASEFSENVGIATTMTANVFAPYDIVYDEFAGVLYGPGQGRYMRQNTDKSVIVYNEIDEITNFYVGDGLVLDLNAANYSAMPANGSTIAGTGNYTITVINPTSNISWNSSNGGVFRVTAASTNNLLTFGPDYSSGTQAFTVGMAYKWNGATAGRLLNANTASPDFLMGLWDAPASRMNIAFGGTFTGLNTDVADTAWHFIWFTSTGIAGATKAKSYIATSTAPTSTYGTGSTNGGFNGLRLFGRFLTTTTNQEQVDADVGFVQVWNRELTLAEIQIEHTRHKTRFGY